MTPASSSRSLSQSSDNVQIRRAESEADILSIARLFGAYAASLPVDLDYQGFDAEVARLPGEYTPPRGALLLACDERGDVLGCIALRPLKDAGVCEMKRLYLIPAARGLGHGRALAEAVIREARRLGYREMRLDTLPHMESAIAMYSRLGFSVTEPYYGPTPAGTVFMVKKL